MIKAKILSGYNECDIVSIVGFVVKEELYTYAIVILDNQLQEFELEELEIINN